MDVVNYGAIPRPNRKRRTRQFFVASVATIGIFALGNVLAYTSPALPSLVDGNFGEPNSNGTLVLTVEQTSWIGSIAMLGALVASPVAGVAVDRIGRKLSLAVFTFPSVLGWVLIGCSSPYYALLLAGRFLTGFGGGAFSLIAPVYISEISEKEIRGTLLSLFQLMLVTGILATYAVGTVLNWKNLAWVSASIPCLVVLFLPFIPETPRYFIKTRQIKRAEECLQWLRACPLANPELQIELVETQNSVNESQLERTRISDLFQLSILKPVTVSLSLMVFEQISGFNAIIFYAGGIFKAAGSSMNENISSIIVGVVQVVATIGSSIMVDRLGRRILLLCPQVVMGVSLIALGSFFYVAKEHGNSKAYLAHISWIPLVSMILFIIAFSIGIGPLSWTMMGEILPPNVKGSCSSIATALVWLCGFFVTKSFDTIADALGIYWCFWIFAICCFLGFISIYLTVPETKGKSLEEIQNTFN